MNSLKEIKKALETELQEFDQVFKKILSSNVFLIDTIAKYIIKNKGKGIRPLLVLMSAKLVGKPVYETYLVASVVELLHTASLVHDDVVDNALVRRGFPSINAMWKNKIAVLMGDYLLSKCLIGATKTGSLEVMNKLAMASKRLSKGELMQIEKARQLKITEEEYFDIISNKTAALMGTAAELGAITVSENEEDHRNLKNFGENLGIAFQIKDDLLDYYGHQKILGKPVGNDFKDKKITLPLIHAFNQASRKEISNVKRRLKKGVSQKDVEYILDFVAQYNGINYAEQKLQEYSEKAKQCIAVYDDTEVKKAMEAFVDFTINRAK
ncbi:MAG: polyprenyl synthetase family protein [Caldisericaceae bacterium]|nr:polyprenyl synthetase family protein [Caldisericaceae bacterium]